MTALTVGNQGLKALDAGDHEAAVSKLTAAISQSSSPKWYLARSKALVATGAFDRALADGAQAYHSALDRGSRDLMLESQYRRAVALLRLGRHADADAVLAWVMAACGGGKISDAEKAVQGVDADGRYVVRRADVEGMLREKREREEENRADEAKLGAVKTDTPSGRIFKMAASLRLSALGAMEASAPDSPGWKRTAPLVPPKEEKAVEAVVQEKPAAPPPKKLRVDAYESDTVQTVSVFTKNVDKDEFKLQWLSDSKVVIGPLPEAPEGSAIIELGGPADPEKVTVSVRPMKVELRIGKKNTTKYNMPQCYLSDGTQVGEKPAAAPAPTTTTAPAAPKTEPAQPAAPKTTEAKPAPSKPPTYPTSSRSGPKNWDSIEDDEDDENNADPNAFFKKLYAGASEEQKRAMMKSFTESNGTALSTDWGDVANRTVETKPPEGVEAKDWE